MADARTGAPDAKHKALALTLAVTALATLYVLALEPVWRRYQNLSDELAAAEDRERRYLELLAGRAEIEAKVAEMDREGRDGAVLFSGNTPSIAAAGLQARIREIVEALGGEIRSSRTRNPTDELDLTRLEVTITARIPFSALTEMLGRIELGTPYVFLDNVSIRSQQNTRGDRVSDQIDLQLTAQGYADIGAGG